MSGKIESSILGTALRFVLVNKVYFFCDCGYRCFLLGTVVHFRLNEKFSLYLIKWRILPVILYCFGEQLGVPVFACSQQ